MVTMTTVRREDLLLGMVLDVGEIHIVFQLPVTCSITSNREKGGRVSQFCRRVYDGGKPFKVYSRKKGKT